MPAETELNAKAHKPMLWPAQPYGSGIGAERQKGTVPAGRLA